VTRPGRTVLHEALLVGLGGALGGVSRVVLGEWLVVGMAWPTPAATAAINIIGGFLIGLIHRLSAVDGRVPLNSACRAGLLAGVLGGFTTFSLLSVETLGLLASGRAGAALLSLFGSLTLAILAAGLGDALGRRCRAQGAPG
jgi:fluoride exporter